MTTLYGGREKLTDSCDIFKLKMERDLGERNPNLYLCANKKGASSYLSLQTSLIPEKKECLSTPDTPVSLSQATDF